MNKRAYTTYGSVRGSCGHKHRTIASAVVCLTKDRKVCRRYGGYSDRRVGVHDSQDCYGHYEEIDSREYMQAQIIERRLEA